MNPRKYMIIDLEKKGDKRMFVTEQVVHISENNNGLWAVKFSTSQRISIITNQDYYILPILSVLI